MTLSIVIGVVVAVFVLFLCVTGYVKAPPDTAYIISGLRKKRVVIGQATIRIPFLERKDELDLQLIPIDVKTSNPVPTQDYININVDAAVNIKISSNPELIALAAENFLNRKPEYIADVSREVLEGNMREIVGKMNLEEMVSNRQKFAELVKENAEPDLAAMGLDIISFNVQNFTDSNGVIDDLGIDNISKIKKNAAIAKAQSERDVAIAQSEANRQANDARVEAQAEIDRRNNQLRIQEAELKQSSDAKIAQADAAYQIQQETQRKTIEVAAADADIARQEREVDLKAREVEVTEKHLDATVRKHAEAEKYARQQKAEADLFERQKDAQARRYEEEQQSEALRIRAEAEKFAREQEADGIRARGLAEAEAIRAKAMAEAEGIEKKAEAMAKMGQAAVLEMYFQAIPEVARNVAAPLGNVDRITMFGEGNSAKLTGDIVTTMTQITDGLQQSTGLDLPAILSGMLGAKLVQPEKTEATEPAKPSMPAGPADEA